MVLAKDKDRERRRRNVRIIERHLKGEQPAVIASRLDIPTTQVNRELALARKRWQESRASDLAEASQSQSHIDEMEDVFVRAWAGHGLPGCAPMRASDEGGSCIERQDTLDSLEAAARCIRRRSRLRAAQSPAASQSPTPDPTDDLSEEEVDRELARITHELELRGTTTSA